MGAAAALIAAPLGRWECLGETHRKHNEMTYGSRSIGAILLKHSMNWPSLQTMLGICGVLLTFSIRNSMQSMTAITARNAGDMLLLLLEEF